MEAAHLTWARTDDDSGSGLAIASKSEIDRDVVVVHIRHDAPPASLAATVHEKHKPPPPTR